jgi:hypothetical protein
MKSKVVIFVILGLLISISAIFVVLATMAPIRSIKLVNQNYPDSSLIENVSKEQLKLEKEEIYYKARLKMAEADSACLSINLIDSIITMEIQGVRLLETKIQKIESTKIFPRYKKQAFFEYFSTPFVIDSDYCTIPKEFFNIKYAPEDTIAAQAPKTMPDTTLKDPVYFTLYLDRGLMVDIRQTDTLRPEIYKDYDRHLRDEKLSKMWDYLFKFEVPTYDPWIRIEIPHSDARSIYKALPHHAQVAIIL